MAAQPPQVSLERNRANYAPLSPVAFLRRSADVYPDKTAVIHGERAYTYREFDLETCLKRCQELGLHYIELYQKHAPLDAKADQIKAIQSLCSDYGVKPVCWGVQHFSKNHDANKKVFEFGKMLGVKSFSANPDMDSFDSLDKLCDEYKLAIGIHPHGPIGKDKLDPWSSAEVRDWSRRSNRLSSATAAS